MAGVGLLRWTVVFLVGLLGALVAAPASAKPIAVEFPERAGDAPAPELDIHAATLAYDRATGALVGSVTLGAAPTITVINSIDIDLGRFALANGQCYGINTVAISIPDAEDVAAGLPLPYTELLRYFSAKEMGFLPTATNGATIDFNSIEGDPAIADALKRGRFTCAKITTREPVDFNVRDSSGPVPFVTGPRASCRIAKRSVAGGRSFPVRCRHAGERVVVRLAKGKTLLEGSERVRGGRFSVPTARSMRGRWNITIWKGEILIGKFLRVRVR
jgi:hypothetical protein